LPFTGRVTIKLSTQRKVLYERIGKKKKGDRGGKWFFIYDYRDKYEFVRKLFKHFKPVPADITIDTTARTPQEVYKIACKELERHVINYFNYGS
jgi:hypothetical protein